jgi:DNA-binding winged helix-turn-helix (wHTH) protein
LRRIDKARARQVRPLRGRNRSRVIERATRPEHSDVCAATYRFGPYILDVSRRRLLCGSTATPVTEKVFGVLCVLLEAHGGVVEKRAFFERVWPSEKRKEANLTQHIFLLRGILGERAGDHEFIVTVPGRGYRFAGIVETKAGLSMKGSCERCNATLGAGADAYICSHECTFCPGCAQTGGYRCPNCGGAQVRRPTR